MSTKINKEGLLASGWVLSEEKSSLPYIVREFVRGCVVIRNIENIEFPEDEEFSVRADISGADLGVLDRICLLLSSCSGK